MERGAMPGDLLIHTIGHSDHTTAAFIDLLRQHGIALVVDVRSQPYSRWAHQFNREMLARDLDEAGIAYRFMGDTLGGRPSDLVLYDPQQELPDYRRVEQMGAYQAGIDQLLELARAWLGEGGGRLTLDHDALCERLSAEAIYLAVGLFSGDPGGGRGVTRPTC